MTLNPSYYHNTVLLKELVAGLHLHAGDFAIDCTFGGGGHTKEILNIVGSKGLVIAIDRDIEAINHGKKKFSQELAEGRLLLIHGSFAQLPEILAKVNCQSHMLRGLCADLGVSSHQLDIGERGFSFNKSGPLDMRMNVSDDETAADIINTYSESDLAKIFFEYGEEPKSRKLARAICTDREKKPFTDTAQFAEFCTKILQYSASKAHPATRVFQALRIAVNKELAEVEALLDSSIDLISYSGRVAIITFHSLEDRLVKHRFQKWTKGDQPYFSKLPITEQEVQKNSLGTIIKPFPILPTDSEIAENPRSRSAKLRVFEKRPLH